jgi:hypothetical protein
MKTLQADILAHLATLAQCGRALDAGSPGVAELLVLAQRDEAWVAWSNNLIDRHPDGNDGHSDLVTAWQFFDELRSERAQVAQAAQQLLVPAPSRRRQP